MSCLAKANGLHCFLTMILVFKLFFKGFLMSLRAGEGAGRGREAAGGV